MVIFIPIGHEDARVHRFPVVSISIVGLCLLGFASTWPQCEKEEAEISESFSNLLVEAARLERSRGEEPDVLDRAWEEAFEAHDPREFLAQIEKAVATREEAGADVEDLAGVKEALEKVRRLLDDRVFHRWGLVPASPGFLAFFTHMFLHGGYLHLIFNVVFFILVGPALEDLWGRVVFPIAYIASGLAAAVGFMIVSGPIEIPMIGASGAIAGLMGAFLGAFTHTRIKVLAVLFLFFMVRAGTFMVPAWVFLPIWIGEEILQGLLQLGTTGAAGGGVAHWAHIAGFFFGFAVPFALRWGKLDQKLFPLYAGTSGKKVASSAEPALKYTLDADYRRGIRLRDECDWEGAAERFQALIDRYPDVLGPRLDLAEVHKLDGEPRKRRDVLIEAVEVASKTRDKRLLDTYEMVRLDAPNLKVSADCLLRVAGAFEEVGHAAEAMAHYRKFLDQNPEHKLRERASTRLNDLMAGALPAPTGARAPSAGARDRG